ncbi:putative transporter [Anaeramoeba ignava]|uniref:Transporter n=1 Tax=Anaeramoeba ignava TaxID=1746090 RepID=A0A9Q0LYD0_ANAIG|nr:putative transporter [Anaeramoeba ignava]
MIQGSAGSIGSLFRSLGPFLAGSYFSFAEYINFPALVFITLGFIYFIGFLLMLFIKSPELEKSSHFLLKENVTKEEDETNSEKDFLIKIDEKNSETNSERESLIKNDEHQNV